MDVAQRRTELTPNLLLLALTSLWAARMDGYFGVDMAVYHTTGVNIKVPVVPDAFLSLGVERLRDDRPRGRLSYATWEEDDTVPILAIELVSQTPGKEYDEKLETYRRLGVLYYVVYNPMHWQRDQRTQIAEQQAKAERQRAQAERQRAQAERQRAESAEQQAAKLLEQLRSLGIEPES